MNIDAWLAAAVADATARGLPELAPLLETLARSTAALRDAAAASKPAAPAPDPSPEDSPSR
jgi:hypothetical protein